MNEIIIFNFNQNTVCMTVRDDEPWFVVAEALGYRTANDAIRYLDDEANTLNQRISFTNGAKINYHQ